MVTLVLIVLLAWLGTAVAVIALARLLGHLTAARAPAPAPPAAAPRPAAAPAHNVVSLLARPGNDLVRSADAPQRRAA